MTEVYGQQTPNTLGSEYNALRFMVRQMLLGMQTVTLAKVTKVYTPVGLSAMGLVDVQPLINQLTGAGQSVPHGIVSQVPYMRWQGGASAVVLDPVVGDIGICLFASRDISAVKRTKAQANPGSFRTFDWADGLYLGGMLNGDPTQYILFDPTGITMVSPVKITLQAPAIEFDGPIHATSTLNADGAVTSEGIVLPTHTHPDPQGGNTGPPNP